MQAQFNQVAFEKQLKLCGTMVKAHVLMSLIGLFTYFARKIAFIIIVNLLSLLLSYLGFVSIQQIHKVGLACYAIMTSSLFSMILVYEIIADLFSEAYVQDSPPQSIVLFFLTLPYLVDLSSGLMCMKLCVELSKFPNLEFRRKFDQIFVIQADCNQDYNEAYLASDLCVICMKNPRNILLYKCGHRVICDECYQLLPRKLCPVCRQKIEDIIRKYDA